MKRSLPLLLAGLVVVWILMDMGLHVWRHGTMPDGYTALAFLLLDTLRVALVWIFVKALNGR